MTHATSDSNQAHDLLAWNVDGFSSCDLGGSFQTQVPARNFRGHLKKGALLEKKNEFWNYLAMLGWVAKPAFANIILWSAFTSMSMWQYVDESQGSKIGTAQEPPATSRPSLRGPYQRDVDALGWAKTLWAVQMLTLRMPLACGSRHLGGSEPTHRARSVNPFEVTSSKRDL